MSGTCLKTNRLLHQTIKITSRLQCEWEGESAFWNFKMLNWSFERFYSLVVRTLDSDSRNPCSNQGRTLFFFSLFFPLNSYRWFIRLLRHEGDNVDLFLKSRYASAMRYLERIRQAESRTEERINYWSKFTWKRENLRFNWLAQRCSSPC